MLTPMQTMGPCYRSESQLCTSKVKVISNVSNGTTGGQRLHRRSTEEGIYLTNKITTDIPGVFHSQKGQKETNGTGLSLPEQRNDQK